MASLTIRDPYGNTFEIDASARPFWEGREGYQILPSDEPVPAEPQPETTGTPKSSSKAASRPAPKVEE